MNPPGGEGDDVREIAVPPRPLSKLRPLIGKQRYGELRAAASEASTELDGVTVWNVNSTAAGGGVAEILQVLVGYSRDAGVDARWAVLAGNPDFYAVTKRLHNRMHGFPGDDGELGPKEADLYESMTDTIASQLRRRIRPGDVALLHDPQTAGLVPPLAAAGVVTIWRCHIGSDVANAYTEEAWSFLRPHIEASAALVFSRKEYVPEWAPEGKVYVIAPSIDPFSPKNEAIAKDEVLRVLRDIEVVGPPRRAQPPLRRSRIWPVEHPAVVVAGQGSLDPRHPLVVQVSRWDRLKDMAGVMEGFASNVVGRTDAQLALVGPEVNGVADDPEGEGVLTECIEGWHHLPADAQRRVRLITLPMQDLRENALMVNAIQRQATVVVQKSLAEGFGLTVAEAMWKAKPVVASAVGGITDQLTADTGILLEDPTDLDTFGLALASLLQQPETIRALGGRARRRVIAGFVGDRHLIAYASLMRRLLG
jgi:trehalose synthase